MVKHGKGRTIPYRAERRKDHKKHQREERKAFLKQVQADKVKLADQQKMSVNILSAKNVENNQ